MAELGLLYDRDAAGDFTHFYTATVGGVFLEVVQRGGGYDGYGATNASVRLAAQHRHEGGHRRLTSTVVADGRRRPPGRAGVRWRDPRWSRRAVRPVARAPQRSLPPHGPLVTVAARPPRPADRGMMCPWPTLARAPAQPPPTWSTSPTSSRPTTPACPDPDDVDQQVAFGTSGHRGTASRRRSTRRTSWPPRRRSATTAASRGTTGRCSSAATRTACPSRRGRPRSRCWPPTTSPCSSTPRPLHADAGGLARDPAGQRRPADRHAASPTASSSPRRTTRPPTAASSTTRRTAGRPTPTPRRSSPRGPTS